MLPGLWIVDIGSRKGTSRGSSRRSPPLNLASGRLHAEQLQAEQQARAEAKRQVAQKALRLYIARGITEAHGGRIWVDSTPGEGSTFTFSLPLRPQEGVQARLESPGGGV